ncbi:hypothetical protein FOL46_006783 [Perkinsus olseni]|uniref:Uncharacterized protein n=1 Tax=Perkinsus olseni TaxID=32597 RepID=A0A7J6LI10_PEROL|nr:hypothetical protein FOL46_006783 [Perkinsus olseni]
MLTTLITATAVAFCVGQVDPEERDISIYGWYPFPGSFVYEDPDSDLRLTYNITEHGKVSYGISCVDSFKDGPFAFPCNCGRTPVESWFLDLDYRFMDAPNPDTPPSFHSGIERLFSRSRAVCPSLNFVEGDLDKFTPSSPDSATVQLEGNAIELTRYDSPLTEGTFRTRPPTLFDECSEAFFEFHVAQGGSLDIMCSNGRSVDITMGLGPFPLLQEEPGKPYKIDFGETRPSFLHAVEEMCGLCYEIDDKDMETLGFYIVESTTRSYISTLRIEGGS